MLLLLTISMLTSTLILSIFLQYNLFNFGYRVIISILLNLRLLYNVTILNFRLNNLRYNIFNISNLHMTLIKL